MLTIKSKIILGWRDLRLGFSVPGHDETDVKLVMPFFLTSRRNFFPINQMTGLADSSSYLRPGAF